MKNTNNLYNKLALIILLICLNACKVKKAASSSNSQTVIIDDTSTTSNSEKPIETDKENKPDKTDIIAIDDSTDSKLEHNLKEKYRVAIILPLSVDSIKESYAGSIEPKLEDFNIPDLAENSLHFIEAALLVLKQQDLNSVIELKIYDNEASYSKTNQILNKLKTDNIDFIIGPIKKKNLQLVSSFAKSNNIMIFSPMSPSKMASSNYQNYIMLEPSLDNHMNTITKYIADSLSTSNIKILYANTTKETERAYYIQDVLSRINDTLDFAKKLKYGLIETELKTNDRKKFTISEYLNQDKQNVIIIPSFNSGFIHSMLTSLNNEMKKFDIIVFGMPNWKDSKTLRISYLNNLNMHYTNSKWLDKNNAVCKAFKKDFKQEYNTVPNESAYIAYDLFSFLPKWIDKYGLSLNENITKESFKGLINSYQFKPVYENFDTSTSIIRIENSKLHVISYSDYRLNLKQ